jgi:hypothetical protein
MKHLKKFGYFSLNESVNIFDIKNNINSLKGKDINEIDVKSSIGKGFNEGDLEGDYKWGYQDLVYLTEGGFEYIVAKLTIEDDKIIEVDINEDDLKEALGL